MLIQHGIPWLGKKAVEMGRYYGSEALRNPKLQKKALDYALERATPFIQKTGSEMLDQLSTKIRPNRKYKTDRKDLDGGGSLDIHKMPLENSLNQKGVGLFQGINTQAPTMTLKIR